MVLKRKRSESEISTSSSLFSSPPSASHYASPGTSYFSVPTPSLFASRTRKRHRDNRPSESEVHQHTLSVLYGAQQSSLKQQPAHYTPSDSTASTFFRPIAQQSSLHSFWQLPPKPQHIINAGMPSILSSSHATSCEDCNASLNASDDADAMDTDIMAMDVDERDFGCVSCGKQVCHACAVSNLGTNRRCLGCAKPTKSRQGRPSHQGTLSWFSIS